MNCNAISVERIRKMDKEFEGKKLLVLGANAETIPLIEVANRMGVKTLVTSNRQDDPAKAYAWKACDVDGMDVPGLVALANEIGRASCRERV